MGTFSNIDSLLEQFAQKQNARLTRNRDGFSLKYHNFEERRIDWVRDEINLAIIIQPDFNSGGVDISKWNFSNIAWKDMNPKRHAFGQELVKSTDFEEIEKNIENLLKESKRFLDEIKFEDLIPSKY